MPVALYRCYQTFVLAQAKIRRPDANLSHTRFMANRVMTERAKAERTAAVTAHSVRTAGNAVYLLTSIGGNALKYLWTGFEQTPENFGGRNGYRGAWQFGVVYSLTTLFAVLFLLPLVLSSSMYAPAVLLPLLVGEYMVPLLNVRRRELAHNLAKARRVWRLQLVFCALLLALIVGVGVATVAVTAGTFSILMTTVLLAAALAVPLVAQWRAYGDAALSPGLAALNQPQGLQPGFEQDNFELPVLQTEQGEWCVGPPEQRPTPPTGAQAEAQVPERTHSVRDEIGKLTGELSRRRQHKQIEQEQREQEREQERERERQQENIAERLASVLNAVEPSVLYKQTLSIPIDQARKYVHVLGLDVEILALEDEQERGVLMARKLVERFHGADVASKVEYDYQAEAG